MTVNARNFVAVLTIGAALTLAGCRGKTSKKPPIHINPNMDNQEKYLPQAEADEKLFPNGSTMQMPIPGTVPRGGLKELSDQVTVRFIPARGAYKTFSVVLKGDEVRAFYTGKDEAGEAVEKSPLPMTVAVMKRGEERYNIYCAVCHDRTGGALKGRGNGLVYQRVLEKEIPNFLPPASLHTDLMLAETDGGFFKTITEGVFKNDEQTMPSYAHQIPVEDRWAIIAFIRALQRSQNASASDVPAERRK